VEKYPLFLGKKDTTAINYRCRLLSFIFSLYLSHIRDTLIRQAQVVINEVADVAISASACGNSSGYIELYNRFSTITEFISGYTLSVDSTYSLLFPSGTTIPPNSFRLICLAGIIGGNSVVKLTAGVNVRSSVKLQNGGSTTLTYSQRPDYTYSYTLPSPNASNIFFGSGTFSVHLLLDIQLF
jgi:hypothetical protein